MARVYADFSAYETYTGQDAPADIDAQLTRASKFLDRQVFRLCWYEVVDETGMPSNAAVLEAFSDAVCAQVQWWEETGDELGVAGRWGSVSIGSVSLSGSSSSAADGRTVADAALEALHAPDLTPDIFALGLVVT